MALFGSHKEEDVEAWKAFWESQSKQQGERMSLLEDKVKDVCFYVVMNSDGQFFRRKGYGGYGKTWVDSIDTARVYIKIGQARSIVTFFANSYPQYPPPRIVKLGVSAIEIIDERDRIEKAKEKKQREKEKRELRRKQWELERAKKDYEDAQRRLAKYKGNLGEQPTLEQW